jgi:hypothetical protein
MPKAKKKPTRKAAPKRKAATKMADPPESMYCVQDFKYEGTWTIYAGADLDAAMAAMRNPSRTEHARLTTYIRLRGKR